MIHMERVTAVLLIYSMSFVVQSFPIENGFSVKFNPISAKEGLIPRKFGTLFAKIPQEFNDHEEKRRIVLTKGYFPDKAELPSGYSNQVAKLIIPPKLTSNSSHSSTPLWLDQMNFLNLPIVRQPYDDYKILVASAPPNVQLGGDNKQTIIYIVFPGNDSNDPAHYNVPTIYFVNEKSRGHHGERRAVKKPPASVDPIFIIDSNRTVTGLRSKEVSKFIQFKNKQTHLNF